MDDHRMDISVTSLPRIPDPLRAEKSTVYVPQQVSLGPFHYRSKPEYETIKSDLPSARLGCTNQHFKALIDGMMFDFQFISRIRHWYALSDSPPRDGDEELCEIMATDGFFLLQFLREFSQEYRSLLMPLTSKVTDLMYKPVGESFAVHEDIMKLENQIPIFALHKILQWETDIIPSVREEMIDKARKDDSDDRDYLIRRYEIHRWVLAAGQDLKSIFRLAFHNVSPFPDMRDSHYSAGGELRADSHLLEFLYENIIRSSHSTDRSKFNRRKNKKRGTSLPSAVELKRKGVMFVADVKFLNEIRFDVKSSTFHLPKTDISKRTVVIMENLVAFEALARKDGMKPLKRYVDLMDCLINTSADAQVLIDSGMVNDILQPEEVASVWKRIGKGLEKGEYEPIDSAVHDVAPLLIYDDVKQKYFPRAWLVVSSFTGCILLLLSVWQTIIAWEQLRLQQESMKKV